MKYTHQNIKIDPRLVLKPVVVLKPPVLRLL